MKVLITGATGFLGSRTLEELILDSQVTHIVATGRTLTKDRIIDNSKIKYILGDLSDYNFVRSLFECQFDVIINTASLSSPWGNEKDFYKANVLTQRNLIEFSKKHGVKKFIYISSPSIYFNGKDRLDVNENQIPEHFANHYARTKRQAELHLINSGLKYIILRPRAIIGRGDRVIMPRLINAHKAGKLKIIGKGNNIADLTSVSNVVQAVLLSINASDKAINETYNITNGDPVILWDSINYVLKKLNKKEVTKRVPFSVAYIAAFISETYASYISKNEPAITRYGVGVLAKSFTLDITKSKEKLKYQPNTSTMESIQEFVNWYINDEN